LVLYIPWCANQEDIAWNQKRHRAIPNKLPTAKTKDLKRITTGETKPIILSFFSALRKKGRATAGPAPEILYLAG
jgi:hypothetical protein